MDLIHIQYGMGPRMVSASSLFFKVLSQRKDASDINYHMETKYLTEIIPEAMFLKTELLDVSENPHNTSEYRGVEFLLSRAYYGNLNLTIGDVCYDVTRETLHFLAAFLLYRRSSTFKEPKDVSSFWNGEMNNILEKVFEAIQSKEEDAYDTYESYSSSSGVPVFGNGGNGGVTILPKEFCAQAHVVSLLRGICARYAPGARQAAAY